MEFKVKRLRLTTLLFCIFLLICGMSLIVSQGFAKQDKKTMAFKDAFKLYESKCLGCHDSVADPEKPGKTRDEWHLVINVMHGHGMDLTPEEADTITDFLFELRSGMEKEAG